MGSEPPPGGKKEAGASSNTFGRDSIGDADAAKRIADGCSSDRPALDHFAVWQAAVDQEIDNLVAGTHGHKLVYDFHQSIASADL